MAGMKEGRSIRAKKIIAAAGVVLMGATVAAFTVLAMRKPSNIRDWSPEQAVLPTARIEGRRVTIRNIRNFDYRSETDYTPRYYDKTFDLEELDSLWFAVSPFGGHAAIAHTFLSFGFKNGDYISISVEVRKEKGETYNPLKGLFREYEIMYVVADERDVIRLRTNIFKDPVYLYPVTASLPGVRRLFTDILGRVNDLAERPEFYNTLTDACNTSIVRHINRVVPGKIPLSLAVFLPGYFDRKVHELGAIGKGMTYEELRRRYLVNRRAQAADTAEDFSRRIRLRE